MIKKSNIPYQTHPRMLDMGFSGITWGYNKIIIFSNDWN
jgi:hypothetical protein